MKNKTPKLAPFLTATITSKTQSKAPAAHSSKFIAGLHWVLLFHLIEPVGLVYTKRPQSIFTFLQVCRFFYNGMNYRIQFFSSYIYMVNYFGVNRVV